MGSNFLVERTANETEGVVEYDISGGLIRLISYEAETPQSLREYKEEIDRYMKGDSLSMIKCWSAGQIDENGTHRADKLFCDSWGIQEISSDKSDISIMGYDVFGRRIHNRKEQGV